MQVSVISYSKCAKCKCQSKKLVKMDKFVQVSKRKIDDPIDIHNLASGNKNSFRHKLSKFAYDAYSENHKENDSGKNKIINPDSILIQNLTKNDEEDEAVNFPESRHKKQKLNLPRNFSKWQKEYPWLGNNDENKAICNLCTTAYDKNLIPNPSSQEIQSRECFVINGFDNWNMATVRFAKHEESKLHLNSLLANRLLKTSKPVNQQPSDSKRQEMIKSKKALEKIFDTISLLAEMGIPLRGHGSNDENSNLMQFLDRRAGDVPELRWWLDNETHKKYLQHDFINEILEIISHATMREVIGEIKTAKYFGIMVDEAVDVSKKEQVYLNARIVLPDLSVEERFLGFYETSGTTSEVLVNIIQDVLTRYDVKIENLRGQCYDGASNMSGHTAGVQTKIRELENRAIYFHCAGHNLNLVCQDGMKKVDDVKNFLGVMKGLVNFVRESPKRLNFFQHIQFESVSRHDLPKLSPFCPTR